MIRLHHISVGYFACVGCFLYFTAQATLKEMASQGYCGATRATVHWEFSGCGNPSKLVGFALL